MSLTSKSPRRVIFVALAVGRRTLPLYSHPCSPKVFTQPQLLACLVLQAHLGLDYRGTEAFLSDFAQARQWIGLKKTPDHSTLQKAAQRFFGVALSDKLLAQTVRLFMSVHGRRRRKIIHRAAADSTGLETGHRSAYFVRRRARGQKKATNPLFHTTTYTRFPKMTLLADCRSHLILSLKTGTGPRPDNDELAGLLMKIPPDVRVLSVVADAGFDSESNHVLARQGHGIRSIMPARHGRPSKDGRPPSGYWRRRMRSLLASKRRRRRCGYTQRWQVETVASMVKRNLGEELSGKTRHSRHRQMRLLAIVHNIMIVQLIGKVFDRAVMSPFPPSSSSRVRSIPTCTW
jgi:hypothetical protein